MRKKIILSITSVILFFTIAEFAIRLFNFKFELPQYFKFEEHFYVDPQLSEGSLLKDPYVFWKLAHNGEFGVNLSGFRDFREVSITKDDNTFRIICIGDSVTFGVPQKLNKSYDTYPKVLEKLSNTFNQTKKFDVINAGVPGYTSYQGLQYLKHYLLKYKPDLVIAQFGICDGVAALYFEDKNQKVQPDWLINLQNILIKSRFYQMLGKIIFYIKSKIFSFNRKDYRNIGGIQRVSPRDYTYNLEEMIKLGKKNNFKVLFIPPVEYRKGEIIVNKEYIPPQHIMWVNTYKAFKEREPKAEELFVDVSHLTPKGHKLVAEEIHKYLIKYDLIHR